MIFQKKLKNKNTIGITFNQFELNQKSENTKKSKTEQSTQ